MLTEHDATLKCHTIDLLVWADGQSRREEQIVPSYGVNFGQPMRCRLPEGWRAFGYYAVGGYEIYAFERTTAPDSTSVVYVTDLMLDTPLTCSMVGFHHAWHLYDWLGRTLAAMKHMYQPEHAEY